MRADAGVCTIAFSSSGDEHPSAPSGSAGPSVGRAVRPRGGVRQRSRAVADEEGIIDLCVNERGSLVNELLRQWARADMTTPKLHRLAVAARDDGLADMDRLAQLGGGGTSPPKIPTGFIDLFLGIQLVHLW